MNNPASVSRHMSPEDLKSLRKGTLYEAERLSLLEHMSDCSLCAARYAGCFEADELLEVPSGFRENLLSRLKPERDDKRQMLFYSIRVAIAACATLIFIFSGALNFVASLGTMLKGYEVRGQYVAETVNIGFQDFSKRILNLEEFVYENEKK